MSIYKNENHFEIRSDESQKNAFWIKVPYQETNSMNSGMSFGPYKSQRDAEAHVRWLSTERSNAPKQTP